MSDTVATRFGPIFPTTGICKDDYSNIKSFQNLAGEIITLQEPAGKAYHAANGRLRRRFLVWRRRTILVTGSLRTCARQTELHKSDPSRFADPDVSRHCRGLAIDVDTGILSRRVVNALEAEDWHRPRPTDEPWHFSYHESG